MSNDSTLNETPTTRLDFSHELPEELTNGHSPETNGHTNGHANGHSNGTNGTTGHANGTSEASMTHIVEEPPTEQHNLPATEPAYGAPAGGELRSYTPRATARKPKKGIGLTFTRRLTKAGEDPFETVEWERRTAAITGEDGKLVFEQKDCEIPKTWSQLATNVVVSKYFRGPLGSPQRETSARQVIGRVADTFGRWGIEGNYFATLEDAAAFRDELVYLLLHQYGSFNSPVWFNIGVPGAKQQGSACFINSVHDDMESIMELAATEARLFKGGSGAGSNLSRIRSSREHLSGGGIASGPVSFMRGWDAFAGAIKSGGTTRRAAKMVILNADHPDIAEFIMCKAEEEKKAWALIEAGYNGGFNVPGGAYDSVDFQNANHSVRVTDEFMRAAENNAEWTTRAVTNGQPLGKHSAREMLRKIADATWICGDPGLQYDTTINDWHTSSNTDRIYASNPCCITGDTLVAVADGRNAVPIKDLVGTEVPVYAHDLATKKTVISRMWNIEAKRHNVPVYRVTLDDGSSFRATDDHLIMQRDGSYRMVHDLKVGDSLMPFHSKVLAPAKNRTKRRYYWQGNSWQPQYRAVWEWANGTQPTEHHIHHADFDALNDHVENLVLMSAADHNTLHAAKMQGDNNPARRAMTDEWRRNIAAAVSGDKNPNYGRTASDETRQTMRDKAAHRWSNAEQRAKAAQAAHAWMEEARAQGRILGRAKGERHERCCPVCRSNFETPREAQIFCSLDCRYSPMGMQMCGEKTWAKNRGRALSADHRAKLRQSVSAASDPATKRRAASAGHRNTVLKTARLLLDHNITFSLENWDAVRDEAYNLGLSRVPSAALVAAHFASDAELYEQAALYNHKVAAVEFCGHEDVYDGTVDTHHNFAILTSAEPSCVSGTDNFSGIFIHNSEFVYLDDTACNLASLNLMKFREADGAFDVETFIHASEVFITAQEIIVSNASYPTEKIARNSEEYRPLGLGYANLGALLMAEGTAYDSDAGRALAGAITAVMTGAAYRQSSRIAANIGTFNGYAKNREPMLRVIGKHRDAVNTITHSLVPEDIINAAHRVWDEALLLGQKHGYRNAQATVLAPTGTIAFMMDCDTTGIEPDIALVKYKKLVGGGLLKIVNQTVPEALQRLGYNSAQADAIVEYIDKNDTIEGAPGLKEEHLTVFDCAFKAMNGTRSIHYMGHVKMMSAAQPFISGAISKTVNVPAEATAEEIMQTYLEAWKLGLKAVAIYRDGSKRTQPLSTSSDAQKAEAKEQPRALRRKLPDERQAITHKFSIAGQEGYFTVGLYEDGSPGEIFIKMSKEGSTISGLMDSFAVAISMALQYGVPLRVLVNKFTHSRFEPSGYTTNKDIPIAKSLMDYIFRWFDLKFHPNGTNGHLGKHEAHAITSHAQPTLDGTQTSSHALTAGNSGSDDLNDHLAHLQQDAPPCSECGTIMTRAGACYKCSNCGTTSGCG